MEGPVDINSKASQIDMAICIYYMAVSMLYPSSYLCHEGVPLKLFETNKKLAIKFYSNITSTIPDCLGIRNGAWQMYATIISTLLAPGQKYVVVAFRDSS